MSKLEINLHRKRELQESDKAYLSTLFTLEENFRGVKPATKDTQGLFIVYGKDISHNREIMLSMVELFGASNDPKFHKMQSIWWNKGSVNNENGVRTPNLDCTSMEELKKERVMQDYKAFLHFEQIVTGHEFAVAKEALQEGHTVFLNVVAHSMEEVLQMFAVTYPELKLNEHIIGSLSSDHE